MPNQRQIGGRGAMGRPAATGKTYSTRTVENSKTVLKKIGKKGPVSVVGIVPPKNVKKYKAKAVANKMKSSRIPKGM